MIRARSTSEQGREIRDLMSSLAVAIHERSSRTKDLVNSQEINRISNLEPEVA